MNKRGRPIKPKSLKRSFNVTVLLPESLFMTLCRLSEYHRVSLSTIGMKGFERIAGELISQEKSLHR